MIPTKHHLSLWARRNAPSWAVKVEVKQLPKWLPKPRLPSENNEIHVIINERAGIKSSEFYRVANSMSLYGLARRNAIREKGEFNIAEYIAGMVGGGSEEHKKHFSRWARKINKIKA